MFRFVLVALMLVAAAGADAQEMRVGAVDVYGLRTVTEAQAREAIVVEPGDAFDVSGGEMPAPLVESRRRLLALPGVAEVHTAAVCCHEGRWAVFFGIEEEGAPVLRFREPPQGAVRLPGEVIGAYEEFLAALAASVQRGTFPEDRSQGHALSEDPPLRAVQERFLDLAARHLPRLRSSLRESADASHRAAAAHVLGYAPDKAGVVDDLAYAIRDPDESVRNNAMRALLVIAVHASERPDLGLRVPWSPFVDLLDSRSQSDLNKASAALGELSATRDAALLSAVRARGLDSLIDIAHWTTAQSEPALLVLGRIAGLSEEAIRAAIDRDDREVIIGAARAARR